MEENFRPLDQSSRKNQTAFLRVFFWPLVCSLSDNQPVSQNSGGPGVWLCGCQLKVIGHVAFITLSLGEAGDNTAACVCVCVCTHVCAFSRQWGRGVFKNGEHWECTIFPSHAQIEKRTLAKEHLLCLVCPKAWEFSTLIGMFF